MSKPFLIVDTNIILLDHTNIATLSEDYRVIIPGIVLDELDKFKTQMNEIGYQARAFHRLVGNSQLKVKSHRNEEEDTDYHNTTVTVNDKISFEIVSLEVGNYKFEINDDLIIYTGLYLKRTWFNNHVYFMSNDINCRIRAMVTGLEVKEFKRVSSTSFQFTKNLEVSSATFATLHNRPITEVDPDYTYENYNYVFKTAETGQSKLGTISRGQIDILGKESEKELRRQPINPINAGQLFLSRAIQDISTPLVICEALSGSGKSLIAISNAIKLMKTRPYEGVIYIRNTVDDLGTPDEEIGFLSGNTEKLDIYLHPYHDSLNYIVSQKYKDAKHSPSELEMKISEEVVKLTTRYNMQAMTALGTRGRTFHNSIIIIDEAQNISSATMQKLLTRVGKNCKVIVIGSLNQIDSKYLTRFNSGLSYLMSSASEEQAIKIHAIPLTKVVRGEVAEFAEKIFSKSYERE